jgi:Ca2+-binding RTX toxin-like protein
MAIVNDITAFSMTFSRGPNETDPVLLTITVQLSADFDNLASISLDLHPWNNPEWSGPYDGRQFWVEIPRAEGVGNTFTLTYALSPYATEADYVVRLLNLTDDNGNFISVTNEQLDQLGLQSSVTLTNPFADNLPPEITSIAIGEVLQLEDGQFAIPVELTIDDDKSGVILDDVIIEFMGPAGSNFQQRVTLDANGHVATQILLPQFVASGTYSLGTVRAYDAALNGTLLYDATEHGNVGSVVLDNPDQDITAPTLDSLTIVGDFDPESGRPILRLVADISDDKAGTETFWARTYANGASQPTNERGTGTSGHVELDFALLSPSATGVYSFELTATDNARNVARWDSDLRDPENGLGTLGFDADIEVYAPDESGYVGATVESGTASSIVFGLELDDTLVAAAGDDQLLGGAGADALSGGGGADTLVGGDGDDTVNAGSGNDLIVGGNGAGDDIYLGGNGIDTVKYTSAVAGILVNLATGKAGSVAGGDAAGIGADDLSSIENVIAGNYADQIIGSSAVNRIEGLAGNDRIEGRGGNDALYGGGGSDTLIGGFGNDRLDGGTGIDTASYLDAATGVVVDLALTTAQDTVGAGSDRLIAIENLGGSQFADQLTGNASVNVLSGGAGNDILSGKAGNDTLSGAAGSDLLRGGAGKDIMAGGAGTDRFVFDDGEFGGKTLSSADVIKDFSQADGDRIALSLVDANTLNGAMDDAFTFIGSSAFSKVAGQLRYGLDANGNTLVQGDTNGDGAADFWILLTGSRSLTGSDFTL